MQKVVHLLNSISLRLYNDSQTLLEDNFKDERSR